MLCLNQGLGSSDLRTMYTIDISHIKDKEMQLVGRRRRSA